MTALPELATVEEIADYLGLKKRSVNQMLRKGQLPGFKLGHRWYIRTERLDRTFESMAPKAAP